jgi:hypothetical protein
MLSPFVMKKLLYNPPPLGHVIGQAYLEALGSPEAGSDDISRATMEILERKLLALDREHVDHASLIETKHPFALEHCPWCRSHGH